MPENKPQRKRRQADASADRSLDKFLGKEPELTEEDREIAHRQLEIAKSKRTSFDLRRQIKFLRERLDAAEEANALLVGVREPPPPIYKIRKPGKSRRNPAASITLASDWHFDQIIKPEWVNYKNEQDLDIAAEKVDLFFKNAVKLYKKEAMHASFDRHIAWWGGDFFTGHIHEDFKEVVPLTAHESLRWLKPKIISNLRYWRQEMDCKTIISLFSISNHARDNQKKQITKAAEHSYDWLLGQDIADAFTDPQTGKVEDGYEFLIPSSYNYFMDVGGYTINFHHGHEGSFYRGGVGGVQVSLNRYRAAMQDVIPSDCHMIGHYHQRFDAQHLTINNSMMGYCPYAMSKGFSLDQPSQTFGMIDMERRCKSGMFPIYVTKHKRSDSS